MFNYVKKFFKPEIKMTEDEQLTFDVIEKLINDPDTKFEHAPLSNDLILKNKPKGVFMLVNPGSGRIKLKDEATKSNIEKPFRLAFMEYIRDVLYKKLEENRQNNIRDFFLGDIDTLTKIKNNF